MFPSISAQRLSVVLILACIPGCGSHIWLGALDGQEAGAARDAGGGALDAGLPDAGLPDAALPDTGAADAGLPIDTGAADAGLPIDTGAADAGLPIDTGAADTISVDPCIDYANQLCELEQSCNLLVFRNTFWGDLTICKERRKIRCDVRINAPGTNATLGQISTCVAALKKYTCDDYAKEAELRALCDAPPGNLADGAPCSVGAQCRGEGCFPPDNSLCGVCTTLSPLGAPCNASCQPTLQCVNGACVAFLQEGDACRVAGPLCAFGLACLGINTGQGKCGKRLSLGAPCDPLAFECNDSQGLSCNRSTSKCQVDPGLPGPGAPCLSGQCRADAWCNMGQCEAKRREGEPCGNFVGAPACLQPATCIGTTCALPSPTGCQ
jgi:hypothetical protein